MNLVRTTLRIDSQIKKAAERYALEENTSLQEITNRALARYLEDNGKKEAKKLVFRTHSLGEPLDNLTREDYYQDPK
jgi:hypothetical protein